MMKSRIISSILTLCMILSCGILPVQAADTTVSKGYLDNSSLTPAYVTDDKVTLIPTNGGALMSPDWIKTLIIEEVNVRNVSPNGRFSGMVYVLDHLQEMGVNGIWIDPIYAGLHYLNYGPSTIDSYLTGTSDYEEGLQVVADFVAEAHKRNIRVFLDIVTWGVSPFAPIYTEHPEWFTVYNDRYKGWQYDWTRQDLVDWFSETMIQIVRKTDIDGYRADCGIDYGCKSVYQKVRSTLHAEGNYIALIGETVSDETVDIFDFDEHSVNYDIGTQGQNYIDGSLNMISAVKTGYGLDTRSSQKAGTAGQHTFYTSLVTCHDTKGYLGEGGYVPMAYASILSPFIPLWYCGEEWNNTYTSTGWLWDTGIYWGELDTNRDYYETIKAYLRIRRMYPDIFEYSPQNHRDVNICEVLTDHSNASIHSYARYANGKGILVIPNQGEMSTRFDITIPYADMGLRSSGNYTVVNLLTGKIVATGKAADMTGISATINNTNVAVYLVRPAVSGERVTVQHVADGVVSSVNDTQTSLTTSEQTSSSEETTQTDKNDEKDDKNTAAKQQEKSESSGLLWWIIGGVAVLVVLSVGGVLLYKKKKKKTGSAIG